jgi:radical SAM superfamily enzyme YgiQ (UPF0313 family)
MASTSNAVFLVNTNRMRPVVAPIALDYLSSYLREHGYEAEVLDLALADDPFRTVAEGLKGAEPRAIGITVRNTDDCYFASGDFFLPEIKKIAEHIKERTSAPVVLGGCAFSLMPVAILDYCGCDLGIRGDGEFAFVQLLDALRDGASYTNVPGLVYRAGERWRVNPPGNASVEGLPVQKRDAVDNPRYLAEGGMGSIETKRGCDRACIYCADPVAKGRAIRARDPRAVVDEIEALLDRGVDVLHTCDSEFNLPIEHATAVCEEVVRRKMGGRFRWYAYMSPRPFSGAFASLLKRAGCVGINFGVDSGNDAMLKRLGRDFSAQDIFDTARICRETGITSMFDLLIGGPGETRETVAETIGLMRRAQPDRVGTAVGLRVYPETGLARIADSEGPRETNPSLHGAVSDNPDFLMPLFYLSPELGDSASQFVSDLIGEDERFFVSVPEATRKNYNYNENQVLVDAIRQGYRGAFWDILRRLAQD